MSSSSLLVCLPSPFVSSVAPDHSDLLQYSYLLSICRIDPPIKQQEG